MVAQPSSRRSESFRRRIFTFSRLRYRWSRAGHKSSFEKLICLTLTNLRRPWLTCAANLAKNCVLQPATLHRAGKLFQRDRSFFCAQAYMSAALVDLAAEAGIKAAGL